MACPYFYPVARMEEDLWAVPPRLPLVDAYRGECRAGDSHQPDDTSLRSVCNSGYARGRCSHFPSDARADAVRFNVSSDENENISLQYIVEKSCWPLDHGEMRYSGTDRVFAASAVDAITARQAAMFLEGYLRRARR